MELVNELYGAEEKISAGARACDASSPKCSAAWRSCSLHSRPTLRTSCGRCSARREASSAQPWPKYDAALAKEEEIEIPVQINGKLRGRVTVPAERRRRTRSRAALADEKVKAQSLASRS